MALIKNKIPFSPSLSANNLPNLITFKMSFYIQTYNRQWGGGGGRRAIQVAITYYVVQMWGFKQGALQNRSADIKIFSQYCNLGACNCKQRGPGGEGEKTNTIQIYCFRLHLEENGRICAWH